MKNDPETVQAAISYLEREQYGNTDLFKGATFNNLSGRIDDNKLFPRRGSRQGSHIKTTRIIPLIPITFGDIRSTRCTGGISYGSSLDEDRPPKAE